MCKSKEINMDHLDKYVKKLIEQMVLNSNSVDVYQEFINSYQEVRKRHLDKKLRMIKIEKERLKEESIFLANQLQESLDEEYIELTRLIGKNSTERTVLSTEELKLQEELHTVSKLTKEKILKIIRNEKKKIQTIGFKDIITNVIHKIEMYDDRIDFLIDLTYLFQIIDGNGRVMVKVSEPRENIAWSDKLYDVEFTVEKYGQILKEELKKKMNR